jgi:hypothetical protein
LGKGAKKFGCKFTSKYQGMLSRFVSSSIKVVK